MCHILVNDLIIYQITIIFLIVNIKIFNLIIKLNMWQKILHKLYYFNLSILKSHNLYRTEGLI